MLLRDSFLFLVLVAIFGERLRIFSKKFSGTKCVLWPRFFWVCYNLVSERKKSNLLEWLYLNNFNSKEDLHDRSTEDVDQIFDRTSLYFCIVSLFSVFCELRLDSIRSFLILNRIFIIIITKMSKNICTIHHLLVESLSVPLT